jgi:hypothetical protein
MPEPVFCERLMRYAANLRFPKLFLLIAVVFLLDVLVPDMIPFADEILFALLTVLLAMLKKRKTAKVTSLIA